MLNVLTPAFRASHLLVLVFPERKHSLEALLAIVAVILVYGHKTPPARFPRPF